MQKRDREQFVVCIQNKDAGDLELHKMYQVLPDDKAAVSHHIRIVDESGDDYVYPADYFSQVVLISKIR